MATINGAIGPTACMCCHGTKCPLLTAFFLFLHSSASVTFLPEGVIWKKIGALTFRPHYAIFGQTEGGNFKSCPIVLKFRVLHLRGWGRFFKGDFADTCAIKTPLVSSPSSPWPELPVSHGWTGSKSLSPQHITQLDGQADMRKDVNLRTQFVFFLLLQWGNFGLIQRGCKQRISTN